MRFRSILKLVPCTGSRTPINNDIPKEKKPKSKKKSKSKEKESEQDSKELQLQLKILREEVSTLRTENEQLKMVASPSHGR